MFLIVYGDVQNSQLGEHVILCKRILENIFYMVLKQRSCVYNLLCPKVGPSVRR